MTGVNPRSDTGWVHLSSPITPEDLSACQPCAATGVRLSNVTGADINALMDM